MPTTDDRVRDVLAALERKGTKKNRDGMARYAIVADKAFGVSVGELRTMGRALGHDHDLALGLWATGWYEARMLACFVDEPARVTSAQMDRWARDFDNWAICDHACFHLFDRTRHAFGKVAAWAKRREEFVRRAAFALLASVAGHDRRAPDTAFLATLPLIEKAAADERNFVKKGVSWALRGIGHRNLALNRAALDVAQRLAGSDDPSERWVGKDTLRDLTRPLVAKKLAARA
jgi:3-methyladenine DNA glycosylase AlkD